MKYVTVFIVFLLYAIFGTLIHECGHILAAYYFGQQPVLHYGSTSFGVELDERSDAITRAAGPLMNILIGTVAFLFLLLKKNMIVRMNLFLVITSFFWSRQIFTMLTDTIAKPMFGGDRLSDEQNVSAYLGLPLNTLSILFGTIGLAVCAIAVYKLSSSIKRVPFIIYGGYGAVAGYLLWFKILGPYFLP